MILVIVLMLNEQLLLNWWKK